MLGTEPKQPLHSDLEFIDCCGFSECRIDSRECGIQGRASARLRFQCSPPCSRGIALLAFAMRHWVPCSL